LRKCGRRAAILCAVCLPGFLLSAAALHAAAPAFVLSCRPDNDLCQALASNQVAALRCDTPAQAVEAAAEGAGVLLLADGYPAVTTPVDAALFERAARMKLRIFVEYPAMLPDTTISPPRAAGWERTVVASDAFGPSLARMRILMVQDCRFLPIAASSPHLVLARVAGYDTAVFGLPAKDVYPLLFEHPRGNVMVATTKLSQFVTARYAPTDAWPAVWRMIFGWLSPDTPALDLKWTPTVRPSHGRTDLLPQDAERQAVRRGVEWYAKGRLYVHPDWLQLMETAERFADRTGPGPTEGMPVGDGTLGLLESYSSRIDFGGAQPVRWFTRADCNSEAAMALALHGALDGGARDRQIASNLVDFVLRRSNLQQGPRANTDSPSYGLLGWDTRPAGATVYYGDDNARAMLGLLAAAAALKSDGWDAAILRCALGNFRTTGPAGFRNARIEEPELQQRGWRWYWEQSDGAWGGIRHSPHYQAYLWAVNLWLYDKTRFEPLRQRTEGALRHMMQLFPDRWDCECNRLESERARMLLPLAWLVRVEDTPEHRRWLRLVTQCVLDAQDESGAILQQVIRGETSNEQYGRGEAPLIHANGDPCTDLLYTSNFALLGLHEAAAATGDADLQRAADRLADFLVRVQVRSDKPAELDGAWFRGFDVRRWDYWGSNADIGWGVWTTESGWTQGWIASVLALRQLKTSLWDLTRDSRIASGFDRLRREMLPDEAIRAGSRQEVKHAAQAKAIHLAHPPAVEYPGLGPEGLVNGQLEPPSHLMPDWLGFLGGDLEATIDLGDSVAIECVGAHFLQHRRLGIYLPVEVTIAVSDDGQSFREVAALTSRTSPDQEGPLCETLSAANLGAKARYVRVRATNRSRIPAPHPAAGVAAWLFADEIMVDPLDRNAATPGASP
jgi:hypothetical protein